MSSQRKSAALGAAERKWREARDEAAKLRDSYREEETRLKDVARREIDEKLAEFRAMRDLATTLEANARRNWEDAIVADAEARGREGKWVLGARLVQWVPKGRFEPRESALIPGRTGVVDVWTRDSERGNSRYRVPQIGQYYIRILKKDGTPSAHFERLDSWSNSWFPEGQKPPAPKSKARA